MAELPFTRIAASTQEAERLKSVVRRASRMGGRVPSARIAQPEDADALAELLAHDSIGPRIYTLPDPVTPDAMRAFIAAHVEEQARGVGALFVSFNAAGAATAYFDVQVWPEWSVVKFGGAVRAERQGRGFGGVCGLASVEWCFDVLGASLICETTALDNDRSIRLLSRLGFRNVGETLAIRPNGSARPSLVWELTKAQWRAGLGSRREQEHAA